VKKTAFLFPGQGSQSIGMGFDFFQEFGFVREIFEMTDEIAKQHISKLCFKGPMEELTQTINLQPAITAVNLAALGAVEKEGIFPGFSAGHSLGEYSALYNAGVISREDTIRLVFKRGELMHRESTKHTGAMHALIGLPIETVEAIVNEVSSEGIVSVANHNAELQIVTTGEPDSVERVSVLAKEKGAKAIPLKVSGAWHSQLMQGAEDEFSLALSGISFNAPQRSAVVHNVTADTLTDPEEIKPIMARQLSSPVRWYDSVKKLVSAEVEIFAEIGPGKVLSVLLKKIKPADYPCKIYNVNSLQTLDIFLKEVT
jgi:[acyl-carrier-protein] S-malonyltransferase